MKITRAKAGRRANVRRVSSEEAIEWLLECGELYLNSALNNISSSWEISEIENLVRKYAPRSSARNVFTITIFLLK